MNRIIKFRVWDKMAECFLYPDSGFQNHYILTLNGNFWNLQNGSGGKEYEVMQFTGSQDKNGKDIYEGDILKLFNDKDENYEVVYNEFDNDIVGFILEGQGGRGDWFSFKDREIVGNVFEKKR